MPPRQGTTRPYDLALVVLATLFALAVEPFGINGWPRAVIGGLFVLVAPGYALVAALFPLRYRSLGAAPGDGGPQRERQGLQVLERMALSIGCSIALITLTGLLLNVTHAGLHAGPLLSALGFLTVAGVAGAFVRRAETPPEEVFVLAVSRPEGATRPRLGGALAAALVVSAVLIAAALAYVVLVPRPEQRLTEVYLLGPTRAAACYPTTFENGTYHWPAGDPCAGSPDNLTVGVVNHEGRPIDYRIRAIWMDQGLTRVVAWANWTLPVEHRPIDVRLGNHFEPGTELNFTVPPPPGNGTWLLVVQVFLQDPPPLEARDGSLPPSDHEVHLWITARVA